MIYDFATVRIGKARYLYFRRRNIVYTVYFLTGDMFPSYAPTLHAAAVAIKPTSF